MILQGKSILLGVTGGIAAYKAVEVASRLVKAGALVDVVMTANAQEFVAPLTFQAITHRPVITEMFELLAETEGIFTEAAGGVTVAVTKKLLDQGRLEREALTVLCITGNGLKTADLVEHKARHLPLIEPTFSSYKKNINGTLKKEAVHVGAD